MHLVDLQLLKHEEADVGTDKVDGCLPICLGDSHVGGIWQRRYQQVVGGDQLPIAPPYAKALTELSQSSPTLSELSQSFLRTLPDLKALPKRFRALPELSQSSHGALPELSHSSQSSLRALTALPHFSQSSKRQNIEKTNKTNKNQSKTKKALEIPIKPIIC
jgi:hypothetical protein